MAKKIKNPILSYVMSSLMLLGFNLLFSLLSLVFIVDAIPSWVQFIVSLVFMAPVFFVAFVQGKAKGEALYRECSKTSLEDIHSEKGFEIPLYKCIFHVLPFAALLILLTLISFIFKIQILQVIVAIILFPVSLMFISVSALNLATVTWVPLVTFIPYVLLLCGMFILGYLLKIKILKNQQRDIEGEIRMFNN